MKHPQGAGVREGFLYGLAAYGCWGLVPLYFRMLSHISPAEILAHRIVWSLAFLALLMTLMGRWGELAGCFRSGRLLAGLFVTAVLIGLNWYAYLYGIETRQVVQASLGYFITPLVSVVLGMAFFGERLRPLQAAAVGLAALGVFLLTTDQGQVPWIALSLALTFGFYGLLRKALHVDGVVGLTVETLLLVPASLAYLAFLVREQTLAGRYDSGDLAALLVLSGVVTSVPLVFFTRAAHRLPLSTLGFLQYLAPTVQFLLAVTLFGEPFRGEQVRSFGLIWGALALFSADSVRHYRRPGARPGAAEVPPAE